MLKKDVCILISIIVIKSNISIIQCLATNIMSYLIIISYIFIYNNNKLNNIKIM